MSSPEPQRTRDFVAGLSDGSALGDDDVQALLAAAVRIYAERADGRDQALPPHPRDRFGGERRHVARFAEPRHHHHAIGLPQAQS